MANSEVWQSIIADAPGMNIGKVLVALAKIRKLPIAADGIILAQYEEAFHDARMIPDFEKGIERIVQAKEGGETVAIYGDYDVDGITSSAILAETFENIGIKTLVFLPHREDDGYGVIIDAVKRMAKVADLIVTIDNGTSAHEAIEMAEKLGLEVIVIDHHAVQKTLPRALVINPHRSDSQYPFTDLCAAGLAFKFSREILARYDREDEAKWLLDLTALGTIADRVPLVGENRAIVQFGLKVLAVTRRLGLIALLARSGLAKNKIDSEELAFKIIPRLNAAGRMQHADLAYALLRTKDHLEAEKLASELDMLNNRRRTLTATATKEIKEELARHDSLPEVICVAGNWPVGVVGLLAGKLADEFSRPVAVICRGEEFCTGSIRGHGQANVVEILTGAKEMFIKFGGHFSAGGFSFVAENWNRIEQYFRLLSVPKVDNLQKKVYDLEIEKSLVGAELMEALKTLEPFGEGNRRPVFLLRDLTVKEVREIGSTKEHKRFVFAHPKLPLGVLAGVGFHWKNKPAVAVGEKWDVLCELKLNEFRGNTSVDLMLLDLRLSL